jgi:hypothetical protein
MSSARVPSGTAAILMVRGTVSKFIWVDSKVRNSAVQVRSFASRIQTFATGRQCIGNLETEQRCGQSLYLDGKKKLPCRVSSEIASWEIE